MEGPGHQGRVHRGDQADQDVGDDDDDDDDDDNDKSPDQDVRERDEDVEGGLHVAQELLRSVTWSAREPAKVGVAGGDGDQLPVVVHADAAGQRLQPSDQVFSLPLKISAGCLPACQVESTEGESPSGGSPQPWVELSQQIWHRGETPPVTGASHGKRNFWIVLKDTNSRVCKSCWTNHHVISKASNLFVRIVMRAIIMRITDHINVSWPHIGCLERPWIVV